MKIRRLPLLIPVNELLRPPESHGVAEAASVEGMLCVALRGATCANRMFSVHEFVKQLSCVYLPAVMQHKEEPSDGNDVFFNMMLRSLGLLSELAGFLSKLVVWFSGM